MDWLVIVVAAMTTVTFGSILYRMDKQGKESRARSEQKRNRRVSGAANTRPRKTPDGEA